MAGFKLTVNKSTQKVLDKTQKGMIAQVRKEFSRKAPKNIKVQIQKEILKGVSPVKGKRFVKYSDSYKKAIRKGRYSKFAKRISPRNMKLSGDMLKDLKSFTKGGFIRSFRLVVEWKNFLADIHNAKGAGKSKTIRRLLPSKSGEKFNKRINDRLLSELKKAADKVAKRFS